MLLSLLTLAWALGTPSSAAGPPIVECRDASGQVRSTNRGCREGETQVGGPRKTPPLETTQPKPEAVPTEADPEAGPDASRDVIETLPVRRYLLYLAVAAAAFAAFFIAASVGPMWLAVKLVRLEGATFWKAFGAGVASLLLHFVINSVCSVIPVIGMPVGFAASGAACVVLIRWLYGTTPGKALVVYLLVLAMQFVISIALVMAVGGVVAAILANLDLPAEVDRLLRAAP